MIMSSSTSLPGAVDVERLRRVELLRAELDRSLKVAAAASSLSGAAEKRSPLCILFHSADSVHIQFSGSARASVDLFARPRLGTASRFIVSPTPNAVPPAAVPPLLPPKTESSTASAWPLRVLTTTRQKDAELLENVACATAAVDKDKNEPSTNSGAIILLPTPPLAAASSPASSVDSGVASPGAAGDFLLNTAPFRPSTTEQQRASHDNPVKLEQCSNSANSVKLCRGLFNGPSWATVPRTRRWIFNFSSNKNINDDNARSPLIDALALSSSLSSGGSTMEAETVKKPTTVTELSSSALLQQQSPPPVLTLQKPPLKKKYGQNTDNSHQSSPPSQSKVSSNGYSSNLGNNNFSNTLSPTESPMVAVKTESVVNSEEVDSVASRRHPAVQQPSSNSSSSVVLQRQFSDGCCYNSGSDGTVLDADTEELHGLPPRAATLPPLRSILKKPRASAMMVLNSNGQQLQQQHFLDSALPRNHLRRMPTRIVLERSVSESLLYDAVPDDQFSTLQHSAAAVFNASILRKLSMASTPVLGSFDEKLEEQHIKAEQEQQQQKQNNSGSISSSCCPSSCSSETIDSDGSGQSSAAPIAKKRVSFSEHVQARIYRSNSSILGQRRKNEKKSRNRCTRRCSSDVEHSSATEAEVPQQQHHHAVVSCNNNNNTISCKFYERPPLWALQSRQDFNRWRQEKEEVALWSSASSVVAGGAAVPTGVASQCV